MPRTSRITRFALLAATAALAAGGALVPTGAFAASPAAHPHTAVALAPSDAGGGLLGGQGGSGGRLPAPRHQGPVVLH